MSARWRIGTVSFLNSCPLNWDLKDDPQIDLIADVPSRLLGHLRAGRVDAALLPAIDYQMMDGLVIVPSGGIGCDGPTLTVRIFARRPVEQINTLACDPDSHTSVALARVILAERFSRRPELVELRPGDHPDDQAVLLIGDKVVCEEPLGYPVQYDLGEQWKQLTGLPFVFAVWTARDHVDPGDLPERLSNSRLHGMQNIDRIIARDAQPRGWPSDLARRYLTEHLNYQIGPRQLAAIRRFHELCARHGIIERARPLRIVGEPVAAGRP